MIHLSHGATRLRLLVSFLLISTITVSTWAQKPASSIDVAPAKSPVEAAPVKTPENAAPVKPAPPTSPSADLVTLWATVINSKRAVVTDLGHEDFELSESYAPLEIESFSSEDVPVSIVIVYDNSGSTASWRALEVAQSFRTFLDHSNPENEYSLITIGDGKARVSRSTGPDTVASAFDQLAAEPAAGSSPIYDVCYSALEALKQSTHEKRV